MRSPFQRHSGGRRGLAGLAFVLVLAGGPAARAQFTVLPMVPWDQVSTEVTITVNGQPVPVAEAGAGGGPGVRYLHLESAEPLEFVTRHGEPISKGLPLATNDRARTRAEVADPAARRWRFTMHPGTKVFLKAHRTFIVVSPPDPKAPKLGDPGVVNILEAGVSAESPAAASQPAARVAATQPGKVPAQTAAIQRAIDAAATDPVRKTLYFPPGVYTSGTLFMRDGVTLYLADGAVLRGSADPAAWRFRKGPHYDGTSAFIFFGNDIEKDGETVGVRNAAIRGRGTIDGLGHHFRREMVNGVRGNNPYYYEGDQTNKARLIMAMKAEDCAVEGVTLRNPVFWTTHIIASRKFDFTDVKVYANFRINNDGLNYDGCTDSTIDNCVMITGDDSHCLKNEYINDLGGPNERIRVANSITAGFGMGIKFGWAFHQAHDCVYENTWLAGGNFGIALGRKPIRKAGPKIAEVTNLTLRDMVIEGNLAVEVVGTAIDGYRLENIRVENTTVGGTVKFSKATNVQFRGLTVAGKPATQPADVTLSECSNVTFDAK